MSAAANEAPYKKVDWALSHARKRGWYVLPLHSMRNGCCSCGKKNCASPAKHPRTAHGEKDASIDPNQIRQWWERWPDANIGIATGPSGLVVLDIDGEGGLALFKELAGDPTETLLAKTGRPNGSHIYYQGTGIPSSQVKGEHLDVRGATGYVVAPGSVHENGTVYEFCNPDCAPIAVPSWVAPWVASRSGRTVSSVNDDPLGLGPIPEYLKSRRQARFGASFENAQPPYSPQEAARLRSALAKIPANLDGKTWFSIGAALHDLHWRSTAKTSDSRFWTSGQKFDREGAGQRRVPRAGRPGEALGYVSQRLQRDRAQPSRRSTSWQKNAVGLTKRSLRLTTEISSPIWETRDGSSNGTVKISVSSMGGESGSYGTVIAGKSTMTARPNSSGEGNGHSDVFGSI